LIIVHLDLLLLQASLVSLDLFQVPSEPVPPVCFGLLKCTELEALEVKAFLAVQIGNGLHILPTTMEGLHEVEELSSV
jgi:hypothetical protein